MNKPKISIIIVNYKSESSLFECLDSIQNSKTKLNYEIIVVDNSDSKKLKSKLKKEFTAINYIKSPENIGYGAGNNLGAYYAKGKYLFILNPDTKVMGNAIDILAKFLDDNDSCAVVAPNLIDRKGRVFKQLGSTKLTPLKGVVALSFLNKLFPDNPISRKYWLKDISMDKKRSVTAVPGSAFMIRRNAFEKVGGYDENFFMYFEESDLGKRLKEAGWRLFIVPNAEVMHDWRGGKSKDKNLKGHFEKSRFYYFRKHYGYFSALFVEMFARLSKKRFILLAILAIAGFLRFFRLEENLIFHGELGHNYLAIKNFIIEGKLPLVGPPTSHPWLDFGPLYYWIFAPVLWLFGFDPVAGAYFFAFAGLLIVILNYLVIKKLSNYKVALLSSFFIAISPKFISLARGSRFFSLTVVFFYPFLYFMVKAIKVDYKYLFWAGLFLGIMLNFHYTPVVLIPVVLTLLFLKRKRFERKYLLKGFVGLVVPNIPLILEAGKNRFEMLFKFFVWFPYRIAGFLGFYPKNTADEKILVSNTQSFYDYVVEFFIFKKNLMGNLIFVAFIFYLGLLAYNFYKDKKLNLRSILLTILFWGYLSIFLHGDPPSHYYLPLYPIPIILISALVVKLFEKSVFRLVIIFVISLVVYSNIIFMFSDKWFYRPKDKILGELVPYSLQKRVAKKIVKDAKDKNYKLQRVGPLDYHEGYYAQNYQYLLWLYGNEPVGSAGIEYTIYEEEFEGKGDEVFYIDDIAVLKTDL